MKNQNYKDTIKYNSVRSCSIYDDNDFRKLLSGSLPDSIEAQLQHHCETCDDCAAQLIKIARIVDQEENNELLARIMNVMDRIDRKK